MYFYHVHIRWPKTKKDENKIMKYIKKYQPNANKAFVTDKGYVAIFDSAHIDDAYNLAKRIKEIASWLVDIDKCNEDGSLV